LRLMLNLAATIQGTSVLVPGANLSSKTTTHNNTATPTTTRTNTTLTKDTHLSEHITMMSSPHHELERLLAFGENGPLMLEDP